MLVVDVAAVAADDDRDLVLRVERAHAGEVHPQVLARQLLQLARREFLDRGHAPPRIVHFVDASTPNRTSYTGHPDDSRSGSAPGTVPDDRGAARPDAAPMRLDPDRAAALLDRLYRTAVLITRDPHEAEDLVQDTYELILRRPRELSGESELHYMRAAMRRRAVDRHRESRRRVPVVGLDSAPDARSRAGEEPGAARGAGRGPCGAASAAADPPRGAGGDLRGGPDLLGGGVCAGSRARHGHEPRLPRPVALVALARRRARRNFALRECQDCCGGRPGPRAGAQWCGAPPHT